MPPRTAPEVSRFSFGQLHVTTIDGRFAGVTVIVRPRSRRQGGTAPMAALTEPCAWLYDLRRPRLPAPPLLPAPSSPPCVRLVFRRADAPAPVPVSNPFTF